MGKSQGQPHAGETPALPPACGGQSRATGRPSLPMQHVPQRWKSTCGLAGRSKPAEQKSLWIGLRRETKRSAKTLIRCCTRAERGKDGRMNADGAPQGRHSPHPGHRPKVGRSRRERERRGGTGKRRKLLTNCRIRSWDLGSYLRATRRDVRHARRRVCRRARARRAA
jgi:hypothetical protein